METVKNFAVRTGDEVLALPVESLGSIEGVGHQVVWMDDRSAAGRMTVAAGHHLGTHQHRQHSHHMWVLEGRAEILGVELGAGSYVHIPPGMDHDIDARSTEGCTVFYVYSLETHLPIGP